MVRVVRRSSLVSVGVDFDAERGTREQKAIPVAGSCLWRVVVLVVLSLVQPVGQNSALVAARLAQTGAATVSRPIVFVHGFCSSSSIWDDMIQSLQQDPVRYGTTVTRLYYDRGVVRDVASGQPSSTAYATVDPSRMVFTIDFYDDQGRTFDQLFVNDVSISRKGVELRSVISEVKRITGQPDVLVVTHSMGGLVERTYVEGLASTQGIGISPLSYRGDIKAAITIDTPHKGSALAAWPPYQGDQCFTESSVNRDEMMKGSNFMNALNGSVIPSTVTSWALVSWDDKNTSGDGVLTVAEQSLKTLAPYPSLSYVADISNPVPGTFIPWLNPLHMEVYRQEFTIAMVKIWLFQADKLPDFVVTATPTSRTVTQGGSASFTLTARSVGGYSKTLSYYAYNLPPGYVASTTGWNPVSATLPANGTVSSVFTIGTATGTTTGTRTITLRATDGTMARDVNVTLRVNSASTFTVTATPTSRAVTQGGAASFTLTAQSINGSSKPVQFYAYNLPPGYVTSTTAWNPASATLPANGSVSSVLTIGTSSVTTTGTRTITLRATDGTTTRDATVTLTVNSTTGTIRITVIPDANVTHASTFCSINNQPGVNVTYSTKVLYGQSPGRKTIVCQPPLGYGISSIAPSPTQNLVAGQTIPFDVKLRLPPPLYLDYLTVDSVPKVNLAIQVSLYGVGFVGDTEAYVCKSTAVSSCASTPVAVRRTDGTKIVLKKVSSSVPRKLYIRLRTPDGAWSGYKTMVVVN